MEEPALARQMRPAAVASPQPTGARDADVTPSWMSLSMRRSTPQEEKRAMNWTEKSGRSKHALYGLKNEMFPLSEQRMLIAVSPSGPDPNSWI